MLGIGRSFIALGLTVLILSGCVVVPVPELPRGYMAETRTNLAPQQPQAIEAGRSARADVLLALGAPDLQGPDERWFVYFSTRHKGGVMFAVGTPFAGGLAGEIASHENRTLVVRFSDQGLVECIAFNQYEESRYGFPLRTPTPAADARITQCLTGGDFVRAAIPSAQPEAPASGEPPAFVEFHGASWARLETCSYFETTLAAGVGLVRLGPSTLDLITLPGGLRPMAPARSFQIPYEHIKELRAQTHMGRTRADLLLVVTRDGYCFQISAGDDAQRVAAAARLRIELENRTGLSSRPE